MSCITVVFENISEEERRAFCDRMRSGNVVGLGEGDYMQRAGIAEDALHELDHDDVAVEALMKLDELDELEVTK